MKCIICALCIPKSNFHHGTLIEKAAMAYFYILFNAHIDTLRRKKIESNWQVKSYPNQRCEREEWIFNLHSDFFFSIAIGNRFKWLFRHIRATHNTERCSIRFYFFFAGDTFLIRRQITKFEYEFAENMLAHHSHFLGTLSSRLQYHRIRIRFIIAKI